MERQLFEGPESGYLVVTWDEQAERWQFRPVVGGSLLTDAEIAGLGLGASPLGDEQWPVEALSQRDPRWRTIPLGHSTYTIGSQGCALTCAAMIARMVDPMLYPPQLQALLKLAGGFWQANLNWAAIPRVVPGLTFDGITNWENTSADVSDIITQLEEHPLILWVDFTPGGAQQTHFVLGLEYLPDFDDILIADPWDGYTGRLLFRYGLPGWTLARAIYGMRPLYAVKPLQAAVASYVAQASPHREAFDDFPEPYTGPAGTV